MKTLKIFSLLTLFTAFASFSFAQKTKTETIPVSGNCGMCKTAIEKAAKQSGASSAEWNVDKKTLTVKYKSSTTDLAKIQQGIAAAGYDTRDFKTTDVAYNKLHACCQYDRDAAIAKESCADKCEMKDGKKCEMKDGKCTDDACKDKACCKDEAGKAKSCCSEANEKH